MIWAAGLVEEKARDCDLVALESCVKQPLLKVIEDIFLDKGAWEITGQRRTCGEVEV